MGFGSFGFFVKHLELKSSTMFTLKRLYMECMRVIISGKTIQSGTYSVFSIPNKKSWEIIFYSDVELWGVPRDWSENKIVFSSMFDVKKLKKRNTVDTFTISFTFTFLWK